MSEAGRHWWRPVRGADGDSSFLLPRRARRHVVPAARSFASSGWWKQRRCRTRSPAEKKFAPPPIPATPDFAAAAAEYSVAAPRAVSPLLRSLVSPFAGGEGPRSRPAFPASSTRNRAPWCVARIAMRRCARRAISRWGTSASLPPLACAGQTCRLPQGHGRLVVGRGHLGNLPDRRHGHPA